MKPLSSLTDDEFAALVQQAAAMPDAPPALMRRALDAWSQARPQMQTQASLAQAVGALAAGAARAARHHVRAVLSFDSWATSALASGLRGGRSETRQLLFSAEGRDLDLRITAGRGACTLAGQVLGPDEAGTVTLAPVAGGAVRQTVLDDLGGFHLDDLAPARYVLTLVLGPDGGQSEIVLPAIDVGPV